MWESIANKRKRIYLIQGARSNFTEGNIFSVIRSILESQMNGHHQTNFINILKVLYEI